MAANLDTISLNDQVRCLADLICRSLQEDLADIDRKEIVLTREEALITLGLVGSLPELILSEERLRLAESERRNTRSGG